MDGDIFFLQFGFAGEEERLHTQDEAAVFHIQFDDFERQLFTNVESFFRVVEFWNGEVGDGDEAFNDVFADLDVHQGAFIDQLANLSLHF